MPVTKLEDQNNLSLLKSKSLTLEMELQYFILALLCFGLALIVETQNYEIISTMSKC